MLKLRVLLDSKGTRSILRYERWFTMVQRSRADIEVRRFTIKAVGPPRSEKKLREDVAEALAEAIKTFRSEAKNTNARAEAEPEGPFTGVELVAFWLLKTFAGGVVAGAGKRVFDHFANALKKRDLDPGPPTVVEQPHTQGKTKRKTKAKTHKKA
jgi:hypothetical protein